AAHAPPPPAPSRTPPSVSPAASTEVTLSVTTEPAGATVVLDGVRLGATPFVGKVPIRSKPAWLKVRHRGTEAAKTQVVLDRDVTWFVQLRPREAAPESPDLDGSDR
ncbi:MAG: PEGA domain-containing protein, partial [Deltaproteobacteria bacterium]|nr:PEGA domain-containing protein [Deltaproteobacteria bacterium]